MLVVPGELLPQRPVGVDGVGGVQVGRAGVVVLGVLVMGYLRQGGINCNMTILTPRAA